MALQATSLSSNDIDYSKGRWTGWFSEEGSSEIKCPANTFVVQAQCSGSYCDNLCLYCVPFTSNGNYAFTSNVVPKVSSWFSEEGSGSGSCGSRWAVVGMRCGGHYCDNIQLHCRKWGNR